VALTKLTPQVQEAFCEALRAGNTIEAAAEFAGVTARTVHTWMARGRTAKSGLFFRFLRLIKKARAQAEIRHVGVLQEAGVSSWQSAAWWLERMYPDRWALRERKELARLHAELNELRDALNGRGR
jgi:hypothetical protein